MALKNRVGAKATDFVYTRSNGDARNLSNITSDYTILFFNNPDCGDCYHVKQFMTDSDFLKGLVNDKRLTILGVYIEDDFLQWSKSQFADFAINSYDVWMHSEMYDLYYLRPILTLYLLSLF